MEDTAHRAVAVVGVGAILPDAPDVATFWDNLVTGRYSISDVPTERWDPDWYFDPDPSAPDKTYSRIGGWVRDFDWDPMAWKMPIPPKVADAMDDAQKWAISCTRAVLTDYGWPERPLTPERTAVIIGNAMAGEKHYRTALRVDFPVFADELRRSAHFRQLPPDVQAAIVDEALEGLRHDIPAITEDTMPGELANIIAGRVANLFDLHGPNFVTDAACASAMAALDAAIEGLGDHEFDAVITGGIDRNMGAATFVKFCKIGALSATGTRPYAEGADGFVMGEGAALFLLKRLADAERDGDRIYAVIRGVAGASDGRGKGITAPNPVGQVLAVERAWQAAGLDPASATYIEGHGTSTKVGDVVEHAGLAEVLTAAGAEPASVGLGSVKSNIGHLKGAAGAAGILKTVLALHHRELPPSLGFVRPNPDIDFADSPLRVVDERRPWEPNDAGVRRAGVSAFGFGGTNFHVVLEDYVPGRLDPRPPARATSAAATAVTPSLTPVAGKAPLRGAVLVGGATDAEVATRLRALARRAAAGDAPAPTPPAAADLAAPVRVGIDFADADELATKATKAADALDAGAAPAWRVLGNQGVFVGRGAPAKVAFLYTGQGSQYVNMLAELREVEPIVADAFADADRVMAPLLDRPLSSLVFTDDPDAVPELEEHLTQTEITQPAVLTADLALTDLLAAYGVGPDMVMGHSLGEYGALVAAGCLTFDAALEAVSARGREMADLTVDDNGAMAAVMAPLAEIERIVDEVDGYVVIANVNSTHQAVIGGATAAVEAAVDACTAAGHTAMRIPVSHAFHTEIVAPATGPLRETLHRLDVREPVLPVVANVTGEFYPSGGDGDERMLDLLGRQVASPVQFVKGLETLYAAGARVFVEVGPKRALHGFTEDVLGDRGDVVSLFTNHPKQGALVSFNRALVGLWAAGHGAPAPAAAAPATPAPAAPAAAPAAAPGDATYLELGRLFAEFLDRGRALYPSGAGGDGDGAARAPVVITGAGLGLPGTSLLFEDDAVRRILDGEQLIDQIPSRARDTMVDKHIVRLVKSETADPVFEQIGDADDVIKLAGRGGALDLTAEFGVEPERVAAFDTATRLAVGAGLEALRDAGIPLVMHYKTTSVGSQLPERWMLPDEMRDDTGVIFASAFPGYDALVTELDRFHEDRSAREKLQVLEHLRSRVADGDPLAAELDHEIHELRADLDREPFEFDRAFLFRILAMGHSQFAELIGARGPNTHVNAACASTTQAVALAQDWISVGRCSRVVVVAGDDASSDHLIGWIGSGFLASGAAATDGVVEHAALPFDNRRHGMILGMGAAALVVERPDAAAARGVGPICEVLGTATANSAFHGTRLDVDHIGQIMEDVVRQAEARGPSRTEMAPEMVFVSHETYTPARGGSASAEITALRRVFGPAADQIVIANTKGFTGHPMGVGIEDVVAVKALETGIVPPVPNFREVDPALGDLHLSAGGAYPVRYALRLAAGFGSQISMTLLRWTPPADGRHREPDELGFEYRLRPEVWSAWLERVAGPGAEVEVVQHRLRVVDRGPGAAPAPTPSPGAAAIGAPVPAPVAPAPAPSSVAPVAAAAPAPAATAAPAPVEPAAAPAPAGGPGGDVVVERVLAEVSAATGYPVDMLDPELDLEADLGIDTVKQAEVFGAIRESFGIERDDKLKLRDYPTLGHVIGFVRDRAEGLASAAATAAPAPVEPAAAPAPAGGPGGDVVVERVLAEVSAATGYPVDMLDPELDLEADLGIDTVKQAEVFGAIRESFGIERDDKLKLRDYPTLGHVIGFVRDRAEGLASAAPAPSSVAPAAAAAPAPAALETASPAGGPGGDVVVERVLAEVSAATGYPVDMLDPELDLEADLGIDTVKQAEVFGAIRESFGIERDDKLKLRDYPTLGHVIGFVRDRAGAAPTAVAAPAPATHVATAPPVGHKAAADAVPRRAPVPVLRPDLDRCLPTGVVLDEGGRVVIGADTGGVAAALEERLVARGVDVLVIDGAPSADELVATVDRWRGDRPVTGVYWLPALDAEPDVADLDLAGWREAARVRVKLLYALARHLGDDLGPGGTFLVGATRLGGLHGYGPDGASAPMGGSVTGFVKAYAREQSDALVKAVDLAAGEAPDTVADRLLAETERDPGCVEVGHLGDRRITVTVEPQAERGPAPGLTLDADTVFLVTGAAGSIVSAITADLAHHCGGTFYLLDLTPAPDPDDEDLRRFTTDRDGLKRDVFERLKASGERATPAMVDRELARLERIEAAQAAIEAITDAGGRAHYRSVDLTAPDAVAAVVDEIRTAHGKVDVLLHAAGVEVSHFLPDKEPREFDLVFDVKCDGWFNVLHALGDLPLGATVVFSSVAGRFGNGGQVDYSAANDLLCKHTAMLGATRPDTLAIALDWTAWAGIGMASRGSIPKMMAMAGIEMLPPEAGIAMVRRQLEAGAAGEAVIGGALGLLVDERHPTGGIDPAAVDVSGCGPMVGEVTAWGVYTGLEVVATLDPTAQPFLDDHRIDGTAVLPGVMGIEAFAEAAALAVPGAVVAAVEDVSFLAPFKFYRDEPRAVVVRAHASPGAGPGEAVVRCELLGRRTLPGLAGGAGSGAGDGEQVTTHFTANVRLVPADAAPVAPAGAPPPGEQGRVVGADEVYRVYFHDAAYRVLDRVWRAGDTVVGRLADQLPPNHVPAERPVVTAPRLVELCFQTAGTWDIGRLGQLGLPTSVERVECPPGAGEGGPRYAVVRPRDDGAFDAVVVDGDGEVITRLVGYRTTNLPGGLDEDEVAPFREAMT